MKQTATIEGMSCQHCVKQVTQVLSDLDGVSEVTVDLEAGTATFESEANQDEVALKEIIDDAGYDLKALA